MYFFNYNITFKVLLYLTHFQLWIKEVSSEKCKDGFISNKFKK